MHEEETQKKVVRSWRGVVYLDLTKLLPGPFCTVKIVSFHIVNLLVSHFQATYTTVLSALQ